MRKGSALDGVTVGLLAGMVAITLALYSELPERVPTHFDLRGRPDAWASRAVGAWLVPVIAVLVSPLVRFGGRVLPPSFRERFERSPMDAAAFLVTGLFAALQCSVLYAAIRGVESIGHILSLVFGAFWVALGLILPRIRRNPWVGIRTPWTLASDEVWARTHRFGSYVFVASGALAVLLSTAGVHGLPVAAIIISAVASVAYSWIVARRLRGRPE